jgi:polyferredoxin
MYETRRQPLAPRKKFLRRIFKNLLIAASTIAFSLLIGILGYHFWAGMAWIDAIHNSAMILAGMGLADPVHSDGGKIFSSAYALFCGIVFITNIGIVLAPLMHRILHSIHAEDK